MAEAFATGRYTLKEIADFLGVHYATVSRHEAEGTRLELKGIV